MKHVTIVLHKVNICRPISKHMFGENHTHRHKISVGLVVAALGLSITKIPVTYEFMHVCLDFFGFGIHGTGFLPCIDWFVSLAKSTGLEAESE